MATADVRVENTNVRISTHTHTHTQMLWKEGRQVTIAYPSSLSPLIYSYTH